MRSYNDFIHLVYELLLFNWEIEITSRTCFFRISKPPQSGLLSIVGKTFHGGFSLFNAGFVLDRDRQDRSKIFLVDGLLGPHDPECLCYSQTSRGVGVGSSPDCQLDGKCDNLCPVPEPSTMLLLGSGLIGLLGFRRFRK